MVFSGHCAITHMLKKKEISAYIVNAPRKNSTGNENLKKYTKNPEKRRKYIIYKKNHKTKLIYYVIKYK